MTIMPLLTEVRFIWLQSSPYQSHELIFLEIAGLLGGRASIQRPFIFSRYNKCINREGCTDIRTRRRSHFIADEIPSYKRIASTFGSHFKHCFSKCSLFCIRWDCMLGRFNFSDLLIFMVKVNALTFEVVKYASTKCDDIR